jgi:hypothetical protein
MKRTVLAGFTACLGAFAVVAASPEVDTAVKTFKGVAADPGKTGIFCAMTKTMDSMGEKDDPVADAKIADYMKQLGPTFEAAWKAADTIDESSPDGQALNGALDDLASKCPQ